MGREKLWKLRSCGEREAVVREKLLGERRYGNRKAVVREKLWREKLWGVETLQRKLILKL